MSQVLEKNRLTKGGEFLIQKTSETFVPENRNEEQAMFMDVARSFINQHIEPNKLKIEKQ
jgi:hypothetical protein